MPVRILGWIYLISLSSLEARPGAEMRLLLADSMIQEHTHTPWAAYYKAAQSNQRLGDQYSTKWLDPDCAVSHLMSAH